ncbi:hypothetical protein ANN_25711 [Periplaneta americana]|uniref:Uncharacterized protein n=1 Tax=Periplaneta americana TaxID=6978 RepID=A0ABQ8S465_PERAM|nr:hypothetical protein ANN_25711 [Periplaneta americana]
MTGLCEGGNEPPGSLKANNSIDSRYKAWLVDPIAKAWFTILRLRIRSSMVTGVMCMGNSCSQSAKKP